MLHAKVCSWAHRWNLQLAIFLLTKPKNILCRHPMHLKLFIPKTWEDYKGPSFTRLILHKDFAYVWFNKIGSSILLANSAKIFFVDSCNCLSRRQKNAFFVCLRLTADWYLLYAFIGYKLLTFYNLYHLIAFVVTFYCNFTNSKTQLSVLFSQPRFCDGWQVWNSKMYPRRLICIHDDLTVRYTQNGLTPGLLSARSPLHLLRADS